MSITVTVSDTVITPAVTSSDDPVSVSVTTTDSTITTASVNGVPEAPSDGTTYGRSDVAWERVVAVDGDTMTGDLTHPAGDASEGHQLRLAEGANNIGGVFGYNTTTSILGLVSNRLLGAAGAWTAPTGWYSARKGAAIVLNDDVFSIQQFAAGSNTASSYFRVLSGGPVEVRLTGLRPAHLADADAPVDSQYFSTDRDVMAYKDAAGVVHELY